MSKLGTISENKMFQSYNNVNKAIKAWLKIEMTRVYIHYTYP